MPFTFHPQSIREVVLVETRLFEDVRGGFFEVYKHSDFAQAGIPEQFVQVNHSISRRGVLRGLHFQHPPKAQGKLVRCARGRIWDVAVDIRQGSPTFLKHVAVELSADNRNLLYIPPSFAHGFYVLSDEAEVTYHCTEEYSAADDAGIRWDDPRIGVPWPCLESGEQPMLSGRDLGLPPLDKAGVKFIYETPVREAPAR